jgi:hypothetical protein
MREFILFFFPLLRSFKIDTLPLARQKKVTFLIVCLLMLMLNLAREASICEL